MHDPNLDLIVARILTVAKPERIILFGSRARGDARPNSDYDVLVVERWPEGTGRTMRTYEIRRAIGNVSGSVDLLLATPEEIEEWSDGIAHVLAVAPREGQLLYAA